MSRKTCTATTSCTRPPCLRVLRSELAAEAVFVAQRMAEALGLCWVMGVEFFVGHDVLYVNEIAPRVHNSGHWTQNACVVSQFEQHMRAVAGWPLGSTLRHSDVVMTNLLGDDSACLEHACGRARRRTSPLWQGRKPPGPQNGPYQPDSPSTGLIACVIDARKFWAKGQPLVQSVQPFCRFEVFACKSSFVTTMLIRP